MKTRIHATIGIQSDEGVSFGTTEWIKERTLLFRSPTPLPEQAKVTLKIELPDGGEWVLARAKVVRTAPSIRDETTRCLARYTPMDDVHRARLSDFLDFAQTQQYAPIETRPIALHEPTISMSKDGRSLTARWQDTRAFRRDWAIHLSRGRLPASGLPPRRRAFMMRIIMPDGFVSTFPAEIGETIKDGWTIRFLIPHDVYNRMRLYAESAVRKVV